MNNHENINGDMQEIQETISRLRNRNVAQLLDDMGEQPPCIVRSIKRQFTRFANDITQEIQDNEQETNGNSY